MATTKKGKKKWLPLESWQMPSVGEPPAPQQPEEEYGTIRANSIPSYEFINGYLIMSHLFPGSNYSREFPSLSGAQQPQQSSSIWSNPNLRAAQHTPVQRPQASSNAAQAPSSHQQSTHSPDGAAPGSTVSPFAPGADGYRFGGQGGVGQLTGLSQTQSGNTEEFPPLGGLGNGDMGPDRRSDPMQSAFAGGSNGGTQQSRLGLTSPLSEQRDRTPASAIGENRVPSSGGESSAAPCHSLIGITYNAVFTAQLGQMDRARVAAANPGFSHADEGPVAYNVQVRQSTPGGQGSQSLPPDSIDSSQTTTQRTQQKRLADMTDKERYGLAGFLATIDPTHPDYSPLVALGQNLTQIGLDLNRPDSSPLYLTFATPFADADSRQIVPEYQLPPSYAVNNVPPLASKIPSFSEDTLFAIFYQYPRDILQELAAQEL